MDIAMTMVGFDLVRGKPSDARDGTLQKPSQAPFEALESNVVARFPGMGKWNGSLEGTFGAQQQRLRLRHKLASWQLLRPVRANPQDPTHRPGRSVEPDEPSG